MDEIHCDCCGHEEVDWMPFIKAEDKIFCGFCISLGIGLLEDQFRKNREKYANEPFIPPDENADPEKELQEFEELLQECASYAEDIQEEKIEIPIKERQRVLSKLIKNMKPAPKSPQICHSCRSKDNEDIMVYQIGKHKLCEACILIFYEHWQVTVEGKTYKPPVTH